MLCTGSTLSPCNCLQYHRIKPFQLYTQRALPWNGQRRQSKSTGFNQYMHVGYLGGAHTTQRVHYQGEKISKHFSHAQKCSVVVKEETVGFPGVWCILPTWPKELTGKMQFKAYHQAYPFAASTMTSFNVCISISWRIFVLSNFPSRKSP